MSSCCQGGAQQAGPVGTAQCLVSNRFVGQAQDRYEQAIEVNDERVFRRIGGKPPRVVGIWALLWPPCLSTCGEAPAP